MISTFSFGQMQQDEKDSILCSSENEYVDGQLVLTEVDSLPEYSGGMQGLYQKLAKEISMPHPVEPTKVFISFIVDTRGDIRDFCVKRRLSNSDKIYKLEADAIRVLKLSGKWKPGRHQGEIVPVRMTLPVIVTLKN